jgi:hypothetical protein
MILRPTKTYTPQSRQISAQDLNTFGQVVRMVSNISGPDVYVDATGIHFRERPQKRTRITIIISGHTQDGTNKRWTYDWDQAHKATGGYDGWEIMPGGLDSDSFGLAYNRAEDINGATGTFGNGVVSTDFQGTFDIQPVPNGYPAEAEIVYPDDGSDPEVWINVPNGVTGGCS